MMKWIKKEFIKKIKQNHLLMIFFVISNLINSTLVRIITVKNPLSISPIVIDLGFLIIISLVSLKIKKKKQVNYFLVMSIVFTLICVINSVYYHYYSSFVSLSLLKTATFVADVGDAVVENVLKKIDLIYLWQPIGLYIFYRYLNYKNYFNKEIKEQKKYMTLTLFIVSLILLSIGAISMPINSWSRLYKLWNRESVVMNYGIYVYQIDDIIQSLKPGINSLFGYDKSLKKVSDYYEENNYKENKNEYTDIFKGKNVIVIHAESMQSFAMNLKFNNKEVTPTLNKIAKEGIFFSNFYSQVGVGTSSDSEFTFNTSLMPSTSGTVFVNYFDREYISIPKLLREKGYYTFSMHANTGEFWNRKTMHKNLGYDDFYSKDSYVIDETIGLGLSDKSFFYQSIDMIKKIKEEHNTPFYGLLITLTNHTPFSDLELMEEYPTTISIEMDNQTITRDYLNNTTMGNYLRSAHYADQALGEFINNLDKEGLLEDTVLVIYGDHDARLDYKDFELLYNYDPVEDKIKTETDSGYIEYNEYEYELDRKVPFIIWTKDDKLRLEINTPTGMIDVLPTLGNMLGIHSIYQLGNDIMNVKNNDNIVTFIDGSFLTSKIYYNYPKGEIYSINNTPVTEEYIKEKIEYSTNLIEISNDIILYNLIKEIQIKNKE